MLKENNTSLSSSSSLVDWYGGNVDKVFWKNGSEICRIYLKKHIVCPGQSQLS